jgi:hypothetical protein
VRAVDVKLSGDDLKKLGEIAPIGTAVGTRYPEGLMPTVNV